MPRVVLLVAGGLSVLALASSGAPAGVAAVSVPTVTIGSATTRVVYGGRGLTLSGRVSSHRAGQAVTVIAGACGTFGSSRKTVVTRRGGFWRLGVAPQRTTVFGATWKRASSSFKVGVAPRVRLAGGSGSAVAEVSAAIAFTGKIILIERYSGATDTWEMLDSARLKGAGQDRSGTMFATASFARPGGQVRVVLPAAQAAPCYVEATSNVIGP